jgi:hypothetical protein
MRDDSSAGTTTSLNIVPRLMIGSSAGIIDSPPSRPKRLVSVEFQIAEILEAFELQFDFGQCHVLKKSSQFARCFSISPPNRAELPPTILSSRAAHFPIKGELGLKLKRRPQHKKARRIATAGWRNTSLTRG